MKFHQDQFCYLARDIVINMIEGEFPNRNWIEAKPLMALYTMKKDHENKQFKYFEVIGHCREGGLHFLIRLGYKYVHYILDRIEGVEE